MNVLIHKKFKKQYDKLPSDIQQQADERLVLFKQNPFQSLLNNHILIGRYKGYRSINITGDVRALYRTIDKDTAMFMILSTHSNLY